MILCLLIGSILGILFKYELNIYFIITYIIVLAVLFIFFKRKSFLNIITLVIFYFISSFNNYYNEEYFNGEVRVIEVKENYYILKSDKYKFVCYSDESFNLYAKLDVKGKVKSLEYSTSKSYSTFNDYLHKRNINNSLEISSYNLISKGDNVRPFIKSILLDSLSDESKEICSLLFLGDKNNAKEVYDDLKELSVLQLFVISGFHLNILATLLNKIFKKRKLIPILLLLPYCYILNFSIPIMRAWIIMFAIYVHERKNVKIKKISLLFAIMLMFISINYSVIFNLSFQLTFLTNIIIVLLSDIKVKNKIIRAVFTPLLIYISIIPILLSINYEVSIFGFIYSILLTGIISLLYVLCGITCLLKITDVITRLFYKVLLKIIELLKNANVIIAFGKMKPYLIIIFYAALGFYLYMSLLNNKRKASLAFCFLISTLSIQYFHNDLFLQESVIFLNVGQGDCTLILGKNSKYVVMIDTGGSLYTDVTSKYLVPFLKSNGIKKIDAVIITHDDYDHCGALTTLSEETKIDQIINGYERTYININGFEIRNINHYYSYDDNNEMSAVLYFENGGYDYLIMGDAPIEIEKKIIKEFSENVDVLRIGHHGSKTSTCDEFIKYINPDYAVISVGFNYYGHPNNEVVSILNNNSVNYFRTDKSYNICFKRKHIIEKY